MGRWTGLSVTPQGDYPKPFLVHVTGNEKRADAQGYLSKYPLSKSCLLLRGNMGYLRGHGARSVATPQSLSIPGTAQIPNSAGGYAWAVDDWMRLHRFLVLGSEGGTYYIKEATLTRQNAEAVERCIKADGLRVINEIVAISEAGRAPKNDPALFALAMCAALGDAVTKREALAVLPRVARIGTHLFHFAAYVQEFRGWGRSLRRAVGAWYQGKNANDLAFQAVKYQKRDGWSNRDLLRLTHPSASTPEHQAVYHWITKGELLRENLPPIIEGFEKAKKANASTIVGLIQSYRLPMEAVPTQLHGLPQVWEAITPYLGMTATLRNLGNMSKAGWLAKGHWDAVQRMTARITNPEELSKARIHPVAVLAALTTYQSGKGSRGHGHWEPVPDVVDALDQAFYRTFRNVEPTAKRLVLALDVSGSMGMGCVAGVKGLTPRVMAAAMAMVTLKTESKATVVAFSGALQRLDLGRAQRLDSVVQATTNLPFDRTDCALPMLWALKESVDADAFIIYTDSETWAGDIHPVQALRQYRVKTGISAKLIVVAMTSNGFSIADPNDAGMLDVVGFDTATPEVLQEFIKE